MSCHSFNCFKYLTVASWKIDWKATLFWVKWIQAWSSKRSILWDSIHKKDFCLEDFNTTCKINFVRFLFWRNALLKNQVKNVSCQFWNRCQWGRRKSSYLLNNLRNFNEIFTIGVTCDNNENHKKSKVSPSLEKTHFWKNHKGGGVKLTPPSLFRVKCNLYGKNLFLLVVYTGDNKLNSNRK